MLGINNTNSTLQDKINKLDIDGEKYMIEDSEKDKFKFNFGTLSYVPVSVYQQPPLNLNMKG
jgi:hypothetical protein